MFANRRELMTLAAGGAAAAIAPASPVRAAGGTKIKAIAFDGFPIIDVSAPSSPRPKKYFRARGRS